MYVWMSNAGLNKPLQAWLFYKFLSTVATRTKVVFSDTFFSYFSSSFTLLYADPKYVKVSFDGKVKCRLHRRSSKEFNKLKNHVGELRDSSPCLWRLVRFSPGLVGQGFIQWRVDKKNIFKYSLAAKKEYCEITEIKANVVFKQCYCSLPLWRVHEIKPTYLAPRIHGLFIT